MARLRVIKYVFYRKLLDVTSGIQKKCFYNLETKMKIDDLIYPG